MMSNLKYRVSVGLALVALMSGGASVDAFAQGGCFTGPARMSDADVASFTGTPGGLLSGNPSGGLPMSSQVRSLAGSSSDALDSLIALVSQSNGSQKAALGGGLARAARACQAASPDYAQLIQQKVAGLNDKDLTAAFLAAMNDVQTAALGGPGGAGGNGAGGIAGGGAANGQTASNGGDSSTPTFTETFSVGSGGSFTRNVSQTIVQSGT